MASPLDSQSSESANLAGFSHQNESNNAHLDQNNFNRENDPRFKASGVYITVHGHFYQPPRENPYLDAIERQPSAAPFHDWNERIHHECYRPNAFARVFNDQGEIVGIVNNYEYLSFNIGPTLMSWLERHDRETYDRILAGDRSSGDRLNGHGNAIAQVYNHTIMPLANERDKYTQIRWGVADFRSRFGREPEGMWLAETAVDYATLAVLIKEGIKFIILAPSQAQRCRTRSHLEVTQWHEVGGGQIDPTRPYRCFLKPNLNVLGGGEILPASSDPPASQTPYIDIFFYDGPISRDMGFNDVLQSSYNLSRRLGLAIHGDHRPSQLLSVATDGETFGHHKNGTEKCLAYAFTQEFPHQGWTVTNYAHYLSLCPPTWEVELKPVTAWSCSHGVDRWQDDCGCASGGGWHQKWRRPLRDALNWLRDRLILVYEDFGQRCFHDPWAARDGYIQVIRDRRPEQVEHFFQEYQNHELTPAEKVDALLLLEMQRHALLMFTSCGWFFEEISRPEGVQILRYAAHALELARELAGVDLEAEFIKLLALAPSNLDSFKTGDEVYRQMVVTAQINFLQVAAHYAISSLFTSYTEIYRVYCYEVQQLDYQLQRMGSLTLAVGQLNLISEITREKRHFVFAVLHLGGWDFHCCIKPFAGDITYVEMKKYLFSALQEASAAAAILRMVNLFGDQSFSLRDLFAEERHRIMRLLSGETLTRLDQLYTQVYRDNYGVIMAFHRDELPVPQELQVAVEVALQHRCLTTVRTLAQEINDGGLGLSQIGELEAIGTEAKHLRCQLNIPEAKQILAELIVRSLDALLHRSTAATFTANFHQIERMISIGNQLNLALILDRAQELYWYYLTEKIWPLLCQNHGKSWLEVNHSPLGQLAPKLWTYDELRLLLQLGKQLSVQVNQYLEKLTEENI